MNKPKCVIVDLDGTLCYINHRRQFVTTKPRNWDAFNKALVLDEPNYPVLATVNSLAQSYNILIVSGRSDDYETQTKKWLNKHNVYYDGLYMRKFKDHRDDVIVKGKICDIIEETYEVFAVFDDRTRVVDMWRKRGYWVYDCNQTREVF